MVREPIQVYLSASEREALEEEARRRGVSRSEALRQGIGALRERGYRGSLGVLVDGGVVTPPRSDASHPPPSRPVAPLADVLAGLEKDRADR